MPGSEQSTPWISQGNNAQLISSGVSALGQIIGSVASQRGLKKAREQQMEYETKMYDKQKQDRIEFWNMENMYNSPEMQMERLKKAGLNPNLVYGNGATATGGSIDAPNAQISDMSRNTSGLLQQIPTAVTGLINQLYDLKLKDAQVNQTNSTIELQAAQIKLTQSQKYLNQLEAIRRRTDNKFQIETLDKRIENTRLEVDKTLADIDNIRSGTSKNRTDIITSSFVQKNLAAQTQSTLDENNRKWQQQNLTLEQLQANIAKTITENLKMNTDMEIAKTVMGYQIQNIKYDVVLKMVQANFDYKDWLFYKENGFKLPNDFGTSIISNLTQGMNKLGDPLKGFKGTPNKGSRK